MLSDTINFAHSLCPDAYIHFNNITFRVIFECFLFILFIGDAFFSMVMEFIECKSIIRIS